MAAVWAILAVQGSIPFTKDNVVSHMDERATAAIRSCITRMPIERPVDPTTGSWRATN
ncbi:MAG: hypothetical protein M3Q00_14765 [Pseudomonadota bacterium]|nr:hypothetical protein [Pseudomonadota bacterium]